ncbi:hypothetical protein AWV72_02913 [Lactiplantibacillus plantarum]|nr:hypothetical protein AWV72_02913 [Lactiplantibacillus plantarum]
MLVYQLLQGVQAIKKISWLSFWLTTFKLTLFPAGAETFRFNVVHVVHAENR